MLRARILAVAAAVAVVAALAALASCTSSSRRPDARRLHVGYAGEADFIDLPSLIAQARLRARGYEVETTFFSGSDVAIQAVAGGSVDVVHGSMIAAWMAISRGAEIATVMDHVGDPYRLVAIPAVSRCGDLDGRRLALQGGSSVSTQLVRAFIDEECGNAKPQELLIAESSNRTAALLGGGVEASALELASVLWLQKQAPGRFTILSDFSTRWPGIKTTGVHVNVGFAEAHPDIVREYVAALLAANHDVEADPSLLVAAAGEHLGRAEDWAATARAYLDAKIWPERGGFTRSDVESTLAFFKRYSRLDAQLSVDAVADLTPLEAALASAH
ncbi:MAG: ABC transporter substrate-binding protein [Vicinamibacterales bacterium]